jgi:1-deoxy-D-xylulose-5-phosphate reductoisomerase
MDHESPRRVAIFGSTGSIGKAALDVISQLGDRFQAYGLTAHRSLDAISSQVDSYKPAIAIVTDEDAAQASNWKSRAGSTRCLVGCKALTDLAANPNVDIVIAAIVGSAGLLSCLAAAESGKRLALANKEALVVAGSLLTEAVRRGNSELIPIDSEHSAIFQAIQAGRKSEVRQLILTASGGPLRDWPTNKLGNATAKDALAHPTWQMGKKITVDSATMMNKALEVIEAKWLFGLSVDQIKVVVHPQSIIHSMVEFHDGAIIAQMGPPDMRLPIQYALTYPNRLPGPAVKMDWSKPVSLDWQPADFERFPALQLGYEVAAAGGTTGAVLNAANEAAVELFLNGLIKFTDIATICRAVLDHHTFDNNPTLDGLMKMDCWARDQVQLWVNK